MKAVLQFLLCVYTLLMGSYAYAQEKKYTYVNITKNEGLPSNEVYEVFRDSRNYMWFATDNGVVRYSGTKMETFNLPDNVVFKIREDNKGRIWFFPHTGKISYYENGIIHPYQYNDSLQKKAKVFQIFDAGIENNGAVWITAGIRNYYISPNGIVTKLDAFPGSIEDSSIIKINLKKNTPINSLFHCYNSVSNRYSIQISSEHETRKFNLREIKSSIYGRISSFTINESVYFSLGYTLFKVSKKGEFIKKELPEEILVIAPWQDSLIFIATVTNGWQIRDSSFNLIYQDESLKKLSITSIATDHEGGIWLSSLQKGIFLIKSNFTTQAIVGMLPETTVYRFLNINNQHLIFSTPNGLYNTQAPMEQIVEISAKKYYSLFLNGKTLVASGQFKLPTTIYEYQKIKTSLPFKDIKILITGSEVFTEKDSIFFNTGNNFTKAIAVSHLIKEDERFHNPNFNKLSQNPNLIYNKKSTFLFRDSLQQFWAGTVYGLFQFNPDIFDTKDYSDSISLFKNGTTCMLQLPQQVYAVGVRAGGIAFMQNNRLLARITENEGLLSNKVTYMMFRKNQLWAISMGGISAIIFDSYEPLKYRIKNFGKDFGLHNLVINHIEFFKEHLYIATSEGMFMISNTDEIINSSPLPLYLDIDAIFAGNKKIIPKENEITLRPDSSKISISLNAICFNTPDDVKYFYRFKEQPDTSWIALRERELLFEKLAPGTYELQLKATLPFQQRESAIRELNITVLNYWWQNPLLMALALLGFLAMIYLVYGWRVKKVKKAAAEKIELNKKITELEHKALRSQMNPHFTFNCLSSIQQLIVSGQNELANDYLIKFSRLLRRTLEMSASPFISISDEMDYLREYIVLEQLRMPGQFEYKFMSDISPENLNLSIPVMLIQPVLENSIRHGIKPLTGKKGMLELYFSNSKTHFQCVVLDNGVGRNAGRQHTNATEHKSYGIDIIKKRLLGLKENPGAENDAGILIEDLYERENIAGTKVTLTIPFTND